VFNKQQTQTDAIEQILIRTNPSKTTFHAQTFPLDNSNLDEQSPSTSYKHYVENTPGYASVQSEHDFLPASFNFNFKEANSLSSFTTTAAFILGTYETTQ